MYNNIAIEIGDNTIIKIDKNSNFYCQETSVKFGWPINGFVSILLPANLIDSLNVQLFAETL